VFHDDNNWVDAGCLFSEPWDAKRLMRQWAELDNGGKKPFFNILLE